MVIFIAFAFTVNAQNKFVGAKKCGMCHKKAKDGEQLKIWKNSPHAKAFETLKSEKADKIAAERGFKTKAAETEECVACHTTGHGVDAKLFAKKFKVEDGVQCEACHGAGSKFKSKKVMKDHGKAVAAGLTDFSAEGSAEKLCKTCHNEKSPTFKEKGFDFKKMWEKIKHPIPAKG